MDLTAAVSRVFVYVQKETKRIFNCILNGQPIIDYKEHFNYLSCTLAEQARYIEERAIEAGAGEELTAYFKTLTDKCERFEYAVYLFWKEYKDTETPKTTRIAKAYREVDEVIFGDSVYRRINNMFGDALNKDISRIAGIITMQEDK